MLMCDMKIFFLFVAIFVAFLGQIQTQTAKHQTSISETNLEWSKSVLRGEHQKDVEGAAFSPDGKWLASADNGGKIVLWNLQTNKPEYIFTGKNFTEAVFDPKGILLAAGGFDP